MKKAAITSYLSNPNLPTGESTFEFTPQMAKEYKKCIKNIDHFAANYFYIVTLDKGKQVIDMYPAQKRVLKATTKYRFMALLSSRQAGKALSLDTPIPTPTGWTTMGAIKDGDIVFDANGKPTRVSHAWDIMYDRPCYKVIFDTGEEIIADEDHQWYTQDRRRERRLKVGSVKTTKQIYDTISAHGISSAPNHRIPMSIYGVEHEYKELPIDPYVLGLWLGDGNSDNSTITVGDRDKDDLLRILHESQSQFDNIYINTYQSGSNSLRISTHTEKKNQSLNTLLRTNNLLFNKHIPFDYMTSSRDQRVDLLCGLIDSDGYIETSGYAHFYNTNLELAKQVLELIKSLGYKATYKERDVSFRGVSCGKCAVIKFKPIEFVARLPFKKSRIKIPELKNISNHRNKWHYIKSVIPVESVPVRCITVENSDHLFLCGKNYIPTSNTTIMTIYSLWHTCFEADKRVLIIANKEDTAIMILRRIRTAYEQLPNWLKPGVKQWGKTEVIFSNDSSISISSTSASSARGDSINVLIIDEMAFIPEHIIEEFWKSVIPVISATRTTKIFAVSTPNGTGNKFHELYTGAERGDLPDWHCERIDWFDIPGRGKKWRNEMIQALGDEASFDQEYGNCFVEVGDSAIDGSAIEAFRVSCLPPIYTLYDGAYKIWEDPIRNNIYVMGVDVSEGVGEAASVVQVLDITNLQDIRQVATYHNESIDPYHFATIVYKIANQWGQPWILVERNNCGGQVIDALTKTHNYSQLVDYTPEKQKYYNRLGVYSHTNSKYKGVTNMRYWMNSLRCVVIRDLHLIQELETFVRHANNSWKKKSGRYTRDDRVMSLCWALFILQEDITPRYFDVEQFDDQGKPMKIAHFDIPAPEFYSLDKFYMRDDAPLPIHFGGDPRSADEEFSSLLSDGWMPYR